MEATTTTKIRLWVGNTFLDDHVDRALITIATRDNGGDDYEWLVKRTRRWSEILLAPADVLELLSDARHYAGEPEYGRWLTDAAARLIQSVQKQLSDQQISLNDLRTMV